MRTQLESVPCRRVRERLGVLHLFERLGRREKGGRREAGGNQTEGGGGGKRLEDGGCGPP